jgi:hypothetical protein
MQLLLSRLLAFFLCVLCTLPAFADGISGGGSGGGGSGTVTSVGLQVNTFPLGVTFSPVTTAGTIQLTPTSKTIGSIMYWTAATTVGTLAPGADGTVLTLAGGVPTWAAGGLGTVTSFSATPSGIFDVATATTTPALSLDNQAANIVLAGPTSGGAATPSFRALVSDDIPNLDAAKITTGTFSSALIPAINLAAGGAGGVTGLLPIANGGTANASLSVVQGTVYYGDGSKLVGLAPGTSGQFLKTQGAAADPVWDTVSGTGTVTSFSATPSGIFDVADPTTTPALSLDNQAANIVLAGPTTGGAATPAFRSLVAADIPTISLTSGVSGVLPIANGGTNNGSLSVTQGSVYYGDGSKLVALAPGTLGEVLTTQGAGANPIWSPAVGTGTVTSVAMTGDGVIFNSTVAGSPITTTGTLIPALLSQTQNTALMAPDGSAGTPTFRAILNADLPLISIAKGGTNNASLSVVQGTVYYGDGSKLVGLAPGTTGQVLTTQGAAADPVWSSAGAGTVTSFSATPSGIFDVATATTTPALSLDNQNANIVLAGPASGGAATPSFRALVEADFPSTTNFHQMASQSSSPLTLANTDVTVQNVTTGASAFTVNLPAGNGTGINNKIFLIKKADSGAGAITVTPNAGNSDLIDGAATYTLSNQYDFVAVQSDGANPANWRIIGYFKRAIQPSNQFVTGATVTGFTYTQPSVSNLSGLPVTVGQGGTGTTTLTNHGVVLGQGTSPVAITSAGTTDFPLVSNGASADPAFEQLSLTSAVTGILPVANGGTGASSLTDTALVIGNGTGAVTLVSPSATVGVAVVSQGVGVDPAYGTVVVAGGGTGRASLTANNLVIGAGTTQVTLLAPSATSGVALISQGTGVDPAYGAINLASTSIVTGTLPVGNGGTGATTLTNHGVLLGQATSAIVATTAGTTDYPLVSNGASADPAFEQLSLTAGVQGVLPIANGGTNNGSLDVTQGNVYYGDGSKLVALTPGTSGYVLTTQGAAANPIWAAASGNPTAGTNVTVSGSTVNAIANLATQSSSPVTLTGTSETFQLVTTSTTSNFTINLPAATNTGKVFCIKKVDSSTGNIQIVRNGTDTIEGATTYTMTSDANGGENTAVWLVADGVNKWYAIADHVTGLTTSALPTTSLLTGAGATGGVQPLTIGAANQVLRVSGGAIGWGSITLSSTNAVNGVLATSNGGTGSASWGQQYCQGRLTLTTAVPVTTADVTGATTVYFTPYNGNLFGYFDGTNWTVKTFTQASVSLSGLTANSNYDVFGYLNGSALNIETLVWASATARATALVLQDGVWVKDGATDRRYLGTIRITGTTGQCEDSVTRRYVWNQYNRVDRTVVADSTLTSWTTTVNGSFERVTATGSVNTEVAGENAVYMVIGLVDSPVYATSAAFITGGNATRNAYLGMNIGSTSGTTDSGVTPATTTTDFMRVSAIGGTTGTGANYGFNYEGFTAIGYNVFTFLQQWGHTTSSMTVYGRSGNTPPSAPGNCYMKVRTLM